ncbi:hypothetical protein FOA52_015815 [Chlamydomonas sp. UWO 241]|nr:hypothetical protein FOA52_015815 [Chlamydomonas sp. UWO 241]
MVRFHWHVENGYAAFVPPGGMTPSKDCPGVQHAIVEIELAGQQGNVEALLTVPPAYLKDTDVKDVGVILAHGMDADGWRCRLLTRVAEELAAAGHVVIRFHCAQKEYRRQKIFEKTLDACATSPFARMCTRWVLGGVGNGARVAAAVGARCRGTIAGLLLIGYPLTDPMPTTKGSTMPDSLAPLAKLEAPLCFVMAAGTGGGDTGEKEGSGACADALATALPQITSSEVRVLEVQGVDSSLVSLDPSISDALHHYAPLAPPTEPSERTIGLIAAAAVSFVGALALDDLAGCAVGPSLRGKPPAAGKGLVPKMPPLRPSQHAALSHSHSFGAGGFMGQGRGMGAPMQGQQGRLPFGGGQQGQLGQHPFALQPLPGARGGLGGGFGGGFGGGGTLGGGGAFGAAGGGLRAMGGGGGGGPGLPFGGLQLGGLAPNVMQGLMQNLLNQQAQQRATALAAAQVSCDVAGGA